MSKRWKHIRSKIVFKSKWMTIEKRVYKLPNGKIVKDYYHLKRPDYVLIIAIDSKKRIALLRQYRRGVDDFVYELPAGWLDKGEKPLDAALRELNEETGLIGTGKIIAEVYPQPEFSSMKAYVALLKVKPQKLKSTSLKKDKNLEFKMIHIEKINKMIKDGNIKDMGLLSSLAVYVIKA